jgi:hypothetical protein
MSMKNSNDTIGNRSRDLPVFSAVPQPLRHRGRLRTYRLIYTATWCVVGVELGWSRRGEQWLRVFELRVGHCCRMYLGLRGRSDRELEIVAL